MLAGSIKRLEERNMSLPDYLYVIAKTTTGLELAYGSVRERVKEKLNDVSINHPGYKKMENILTAGVGK